MLFILSAYDACFRMKIHYYTNMKMDHFVKRNCKNVRAKAFKTS